MTKFLILHGTDASPEYNWFMWLKGKLIGEGYKVWLPQLPDSKNPNTETYNNFLFSNKEFNIDQETVIIGHSSGAVEILSLLQHLPVNIIIKTAILVSVFKNNLGMTELEGLFIEPFNFNEIKKHSERFIFIHSDNDPYCPLDGARYISEQCEGEFIIIEGQGHFNTEINPDYKQFPALLDIIKKSIS